MLVEHVSNRQLFSTVLAGERSLVISHSFRPDSDPEHAGQIEGMVYTYLRTLESNKLMKNEVTEQFKLECLRTL